MEYQLLDSEVDVLPEVNTGNVTHCMTDITLTWLELAIWAPLRPNWGGTLHKDSLFPSLNPLLWGQRRDLYLKLEKEVHQWGNYHLNDGAKQQYSTTASSHAQDSPNFFKAFSRHSLGSAVEWYKGQCQVTCTSSASRPGQALSFGTGCFMFSSRISLGTTFALHPVSV